MSLQAFIGLCAKPCVVPVRRSKLTWCYTLGTAVVRGNFDTRPIEMQVGRGLNKVYHCCVKIDQY